MGLDIKAKIFPHYFKEIVEEKKHTDYRQFDTITFVNTETQEMATYKIGLIYPHKYEGAMPSFGDITFEPNGLIYCIVLGERMEKP